MITLASTIHDPENQLGYLIIEAGGSLRDLFDSATVIYTSKTHSDTISLLKKEGYSALKAKDTVISSYQTALTKSSQSNCDRTFYCDFDRALHWFKKYPDELKQLVSTPPGNDYVLVGRTKRAFQTHPETQTVTEGIGNTIASKMLSLPETRDILGTTWILSPELAEMIIKKEPRNQFGFYTEWPMTLWRKARSPSYLEVEGLEWETPDRYREEIKTQGLEKWKQNFQTVSEWKKRTAMLRDFIDSSLVS